MHLILIIDSDVSLSNYILKILDPKEYTGILSLNSNHIRYQLEQQTVSLIILGTPKSTMFEFMIYEKCYSYQIPILFLVTAQDVANLINAIDYGINDYITIPFKRQDLLTKIQLLIHHKPNHTASLTYGDIQINLRKHCIYRNGHEIFLTPKEFSLFILLIHNKGIALTRDQILENIWGYDYQGETRTVDVHIQQLRKKLNLYGRLTTIPKLGYRLEDTSF